MITDIGTRKEQMMEKSIEYVCERLNKDKTLNFVGIAVTVLHTNGIDACIQQFKDKNILLKGIILLPSHPQTGRLLSKNSFINLSENIEVINFKYDLIKINKPTAIEGRIFAYKSAKKNDSTRLIYLAWTEISYLWINYIEKNVPNSKVCFILIDDGGGSYADKFKNALETEIYNNGESSLKTFIKVSVRLAYLNILFNKLNKIGRVIDNRLFVKRNDSKKSRLIRNEKIVKYYDDLYLEMSQKYVNQKIDIYNNAVVINTQCLVENQMTDGKVDLDLYYSLCSKLCDEGIKVVLKPHPRETNPDKYRKCECEIFTDNNVSQEFIIAAAKERPICVVSIFSSTLLNLYGIFEIPAISLAKILINNGGISKTLKKQLENFVDQYNDIFIFPESIDETVEIIKKINSHSKIYDGIQGRGKLLDIFP